MHLQGMGERQDAEDLEVQMYSILTQWFSNGGIVTLQPERHGLWPLMDCAALEGVRSSLDS